MSQHLPIFGVCSLALHSVKEIMDIRSCDVKRLPIALQIKSVGIMPTSFKANDEPVAKL
jgi:hypothetical protein